MSHFAQIDDNDTVIQVIVAEQDFINSGAVGDPSRWIQTSYNTMGGVHRLGGTPLRKNYAGIGYTYHRQLDAFIPPKPYPSWVLDETTCLYNPPIPYPADAGQGDPPNMYMWNEDEQGWTLLPPPQAG
jgi:hypothetical protein